MACGICGEAGHNRRTCQNKASAKPQAKAKAAPKKTPAAKGGPAKPAGKASAPTTVKKNRQLTSQSKAHGVTLADWRKEVINLIRQDVSKKEITRKKCIYSLRPLHEEVPSQVDHILEVQTLAVAMLQTDYFSKEILKHVQRGSSNKEACITKQPSSIQPFFNVSRKIQNDDFNIARVDAVVNNLKGKAVTNFLELLDSSKVPDTSFENLLSDQLYRGTTVHLDGMDSCRKAARNIVKCMESCRDEFTHRLGDPLDSVPKPGSLAKSTHRDIVKMYAGVNDNFELLLDEFEKMRM